MARYTGPVCRICRREGIKLFLKGERCYTDKCPIAKHHPAPGMHGATRHKPTEYAIRLREKQKARRFYGVGERQFRRYFARAARSRGVTGEELLRLLERRLDNFVARAGFATSRAEARQLVLHGHFTVNGKRVNIPSYWLRPGDVVAVKEASRDLEHFKLMRELAAHRTAPSWMSVDMDALMATVLRLPQREEVDAPVDEHLIVELYSK